MIFKRLEKHDLTRGFQATLKSLPSMKDLTDAEMLEVLEEIQQNPRHFVIIAIEDGEVVAATTLLVERKFIRGGGRVGHVEDVARRKGEKWEGRGIGRMLMEHVIGVARQHTCYKVILDCNDHNKKFYESLGFYQHEVEMRLDL